MLPKVVFHVDMFGFVMQGVFGLMGKKVYGLYSKIHLEHMLDLTFSQPQIRNTVKHHFGVGLKS